MNPRWPEKDIGEVVSVSQQLAGELRREGHPVVEACLADSDLVSLLSPFVRGGMIVFNFCDELPGEPHSEARVAMILEDMGFAFTGASARNLRFCQDKQKVKTELEAHRIPTPAWSLCDRSAPENWDRYPAIVKPAFEHCSLGVTREAVVQTAADMAERIGYVRETFAQPALVEEFIDGREFHVGVLGNGRLRVLPIAEMDFGAFTDVRDRLCTYESKFDPSSPSYNLIQLRLPAPLREDEERRLRETAVAAYRAAGCRDYARLDIRMQDGVFWVLDVNPNADISPDASFAMAAETAGFSFGQLGSLLVNLAAQRHAATRHGG